MHALTMAADRRCALLVLLALTVSAAGAGATQDAVAAAQQATADRVVRLPRQPRAGFRQHAGYVTVNETHGRALFYWFVEATAGADKKPLVLWLNGGPGCSSLYGAIQELGPFLIQKGKPELHHNPEAWNKEANLLFSYTNTTKDLSQYGDTDTLAAHDMYKFMVGWFKRFPNFKGHEFYIAGESYADDKVTRCHSWLKEMNEGRRRINLKGIMIGKPALDKAADDRGMIQSAWDHAVMSDELYGNITRACHHFSDDSGESDASYERKRDSCDELLDRFYATFGNNVDLYSLYSPTCTNTTTSAVRRRHHRAGLRYVGNDPCARNYSEAYLNRADVQRALHATAAKNGPWTVCNYHLFENWHGSPASVLPVIKKLVDARLRVWVYSGDTDPRVPAASTRYARRKLNLETARPWRKWFAAGGDQVAGFTVVYKGLVYVTIRGAGHAAPEFAQVEARQMFSHFLAGRELPANPNMSPPPMPSWFQGFCCQPMVLNRSQ